MNRVKDIQEKANAPRIDKEASKRFVRSALWQMAKKKAKQTSSNEGNTGKKNPSLHTNTNRTVSSVHASQECSDENTITSLET